MDTSFLASTEVIDWDSASVRKLASDLARCRENVEDVAKSCFEWVRDRIPHSGDYELDPVTCSASQVLAHGTGFCYAKSHLLAALLRANAIPAGLVYQRLSIGDGQFCLHGLNAVHLPNHGWYRIDARGKRTDLESEFTPPRELLPFQGSEPGEKTFSSIWAEPVPPVLSALTAYRRRTELLCNMPDAVELNPPNP
jgi:transglutaminase-like putative cysteine protease